MKNPKPYLPHSQTSYSQNKNHNHSAPVGIEESLNEPVFYKPDGFFQPQSPLTTKLTPLQDSMDDWIDDARNSNDVRDRIAVTTGVSRGVFGRLHLGGIEDAGAASNDDQYSGHLGEDRHCA